MLAPRMTTAQKLNIGNPATGLMIYDTDINCLSVNQGSPSLPNWMCQQFVPNSIIPQVVVSSSTLSANTSTNWQQWIDIPGLEATFTLLESRVLKVDWTLFTGQDNTSTNDGFAQMFTILEINGVRDETPSNYLPMIHNTGVSNFRLLMLPNTYTHSLELVHGTYTIKGQVYVAAFLGSTTEIKIGQIFSSWNGGSNMTTNENENAASNKMGITFL